ncbi:SRPBCC family protein [Cryptosporangium arvum]|uniref:SRPBCC family protein n=1 Tax=Cryptosporangium arvum TaxID=80871 RepID=UPI0004BAF1B2|nr:SRPBCC family protein [Cryptosporangium arvum]
MDLTHHFHVPAGIDEAWAHFQNVSEVATCFPGAQVTSVDGDEFTGSCKVKLGPIALVYNGSGSFSQRDESKHTLVVEAKGRDKRGNGTASATATLRMAEAEGGGTDVEVVTDLAITGKPAQFGRGLIQDVSDKLLGQFVECLGRQLGPEADEPPEPAASPVSGSSAPSAPAGAAPDGPVSDGPVSAGGGSAAAAPAAAPAAAAPAAAPAAPAAAASQSPARAVRPAPPQPEALDLGATVLPVLARAYWKPALAVVVALAVLFRLLRRRSG